MVCYINSLENTIDNGGSTGRTAENKYCKFSLYYRRKAKLEFLLWSQPTKNRIPSKSIPPLFLVLSSPLFLSSTLLPPLFSSFTFSSFPPQSSSFTSYGGMLGADHVSGCALPQRTWVPHSRKTTPQKRTIRGIGKYICAEIYAINNKGEIFLANKHEFLLLHTVLISFSDLIPDEPQPSYSTWAGFSCSGIICQPTTRIRIQASGTSEIVLGFFGD